MLIDQPKKAVAKTITFRIDNDLITEFRSLCKEHDLKQVAIIENAMRKAILEMKELGSKHDGNI